MVFLAEDGDDVEGGATGQTSGNQFDRLGASRSGGIVNDELMLAASAGDELSALLKWLS
jgi:hypothetical protein